jgi:hypothetical protein
MTPESSNLATLVTRLERLERQNRWFKRLGGVVLVVACVGLLMAAQGQSGPKAVDANRVSLRDDAGNERGFVKASADGMAIVFTAGGGPRTGLILTGDGVLIQYYDNRGLPKTGVSVENRGIGMGTRTSDVGTDEGNDAVLDVVGLALKASNLVAKPQP